MARELRDQQEQPLLPQTTGGSERPRREVSDGSREASDRTNLSSRWNQEAEVKREKSGASFGWSKDWFSDDAASNVANSRPTRKKRHEEERSMDATLSLFIAQLYLWAITPYKGDARDVPTLSLTQACRNLQGGAMMGNLPHRSVWLHTVSLSPRTSFHSRPGGPGRISPRDRGCARNPGCR
jgi:hypothetical protein